jgi:hypothetical protein
MSNVRAIALRTVIFTALWLALLAFCLVLGFSPVVELRFGELVLPIAVSTSALLAFIFALLRPTARVHVLRWSRIFAVAGLLSVFGVALMSRLTAGFSCEYACFGLLNNALGYACGEWARGCIAEWFSLFLVSFSAALVVFSRYRPNLAFKRDALKRAP